MRRELPPRPHLDHLKKQAKDLLEAHKRGKPQAIERIRGVLPSFAGRSPAEVASASLALHDAQSAIAREYGFRSWSELRAEVAKRTGGAFPEAMIRSLMNQPLPDAAAAALKDAWSRRSDAAAALGHDLPRALPLLAARNVLLVPGALAPIHVGRAASLAAIDAALRATPPTLAVFSQRAVDAEDISPASLHPIGCQALVHAKVPEGDRAFVILEGLRWISLESLEPSGKGAGHAIAAVALAPTDEGAEAAEIPALTEALRARARRLASGLPEAARAPAIAMLDAIDEPERLADLVMANLPCSVEDTARYASEPKLVDKLRLAGALAGG